MPLFSLKLCTPSMSPSLIPFVASRIPGIRLRIGSLDPHTMIVKDNVGS